MSAGVVGRTIALKQLCEAVLAGTADLMALRQSGELTDDMLWVAEEGRDKYVRAVAAGDITPRLLRAARLRRCGACPNRRRRPKQRSGLGYCGQPFQDHRDGPPGRRTCGCLLEGKASVLSEKCDSGMWPS